MPKSPPAANGGAARAVTIRQSAPCSNVWTMPCCDQHALSATRDGLNLAAFEAMATCLAHRQGPSACAGADQQCTRGSWLALHLNMLPPWRRNWALAPWTPPTSCCGCSPTMCCWSSASAATPVALRKWRSTFATRGPGAGRLPTARLAPAATLAHHHLQLIPRTPSPFDSYTAAFFLCNAPVSAVAQLRPRAVPQVLARRDSL